jgi:L-seryl-tRNA(Ser) seleniumtransferase
MSDPSDRRRNLPPVNTLLDHPALATWRDRVPREGLLEAARAPLAEARAGLAADSAAPDADALAAQAVARLEAATAPSLRPVINASGVIIQTNLGRAPLSRAAQAAMVAAAGYSNLEYDLDSGTRGSRYVHAAHLLTRLTGAEDALVVNNAAAALFFVLTAFAAGREVILSRGEAVEIGGGFRIPDILRQSGAALVEVGTTNRTYARDYEAAVTERSAGLLRVHTSNFRVVGFTHSPALADLAAIAHRQGLWLADDTGSGALLDPTPYGLSPEPLVAESVAAGADLVLFSGDKLLGGPQAGCIVGRADRIAALRRHPLARALRVDKLTYAALEATLLHYVRGEATREIPVWAMISASADALASRAHAWAAALQAAGLPAHVLPGHSAVGGGTLPGDTLPTWLLALGGDQGLAQRLRQGTPAVVARVEHDTLLCDPRTVLPDQDADLLAALLAAWQDGT